MSSNKNIKCEALGKTGVFNKYRLVLSPEVVKYTGAFVEKVTSNYIAREGSPDYELFSEFHSLLNELNPENYLYNIEKDHDSTEAVYYLSIPLGDE